MTLRRTTTLITTRGALVLTASVLWILLTPRVENLGPQDMVQSEGGDIHRHDFIRRFGWPMTCAEHYEVNWYVYRPSDVGGATPEQRELWTRERIAAIEAIPEHERHSDLQADLIRHRAIADGNFWNFHWKGIVAVVSVWIVLIQLFVTGGRYARSAWIMRRRSEGHCPVCGYDLRATPDRCSECGALRQVH